MVGYSLEYKEDMRSRFQKVETMGSAKSETDPACELPNHAVHNGESCDFLRKHVSKITSAI